MWRIEKNVPLPLPETRLGSEGLLEARLEEWIAADPEILGEPLFLIGRQVLIPDTKDRLDLLALDPQGNTVVIELKRGDLTDPVDVQALRYASYIAKWSFAELEGLARRYYEAEKGFDFNEAFERFCTEARGEVPEDINLDQRMIIAGAAVREKLGSVALWLREHHIDIKLIEVRAYKEADSLLIEPKILVPVEVSRFKEVGRARNDATSPWTNDGRTWHLENRCSPETKEMLLALQGILEELVELDGPHWNQKYYVAFRRNNFNWLRVITRPSMLVLDFQVLHSTFDPTGLAERLGLAEFDTDEDLSEKLNTPSSVFIKRIRSNHDRIRIRAKEGFVFGNEAFRNFIVEAYEASPR